MVEVLYQTQTTTTTTTTNRPPTRNRAFRKHRELLSNARQQNCFWIEQASLSHLTVKSKRSGRRRRRRRTATHLKPCQFSRKQKKTTTMAIPTMTDTKRVQNDPPTSSSSSSSSSLSSSSTATFATAAVDAPWFGHNSSNGSSHSRRQQRQHRQTTLGFILALMFVTFNVSNTTMMNKPFMTDFLFLLAQQQQQQDTETAGTTVVPISSSSCDHDHKAKTNTTSLSTNNVTAADTDNDDDDEVIRTPLSPKLQRHREIGVDPIYYIWTCTNVQVIMQ
jgi:hypothetical protein